MCGGLTWTPQEQGIPAFVTDLDEIEGGFSVGTLQQAEVLTKEEKKKGVELLSCKQMGSKSFYINMILIIYMIGL